MCGARARQHQRRHRRYQEADDVIAQRLYGSRRNVNRWLQVARHPCSQLQLQAIDYLYEGASGGSVVQLNWRIWHAAARYNNLNLLARLIEGFKMRREQGSVDFSVEPTMFNSYADVVTTAWGYCNYQAADQLLAVLDTGDDVQDVFYEQIARSCLWRSVRNGSYDGAQKALHEFETWLDDDDLEGAVSDAIRFNHTSLAKRLYEPLRGKVYDDDDFDYDDGDLHPHEQWLWHAFNLNDTEALEWLCDEFYGVDFEIGRLLHLAIVINCDLRALRFIISRYDPCINCAVLPMVLRNCQAPFRHSDVGGNAARHAIFHYVCKLSEEEK